jgi:hypothetical protein
MPLSRQVVTSFFQKLAVWRHDSAHAGDSGTQHRNQSLIAPRVAGWFSNLCDTDYNLDSDIRTEWQRFSDEELHTHVLRWNSEGSQGLSAASTVDLAIDRLYPHRLARFLETRQSAAGAMFALSTLRGVVDTELDDSIMEKWTSADDEQQQRWTIRLLQIILDPRVCAPPSPANKLPRLEAYRPPSRVAPRWSSVSCCMGSSRVPWRVRTTCGTCSH